MKEKIKAICEGNKNIIYGIISILFTIGLNMTINVGLNEIKFDGNHMIWLLICVSIFFILKMSNRYKEKRLVICGTVLGILLAIFQTIGIITSGNWISHEAIFSKKVILFIIVKLIVYSMIFKDVVKIIFSWLESRKEESKSKKDLFKPSLKMFFIVAGIFMIVWMPYFLNYYPGITSYDTNYQLMQGYGVYGYSNHHPMIHTLIITAIVKMGYAIAGNYNFGIALCAIIQMLACAATFSFVIYYMAKKNINPVIKTLTFLFFAFLPIVPQFSIAIWKDVPFTLLMTLFMIGLIEMITNGDKFLKSVKYNILLAVIITLTMFFRNNGIYIILLTLPFVLFWKRTYWNRILVIFVLPMIVYLIITGPIYAKLNIAKSSPREMLSIPIQQMARIVTYKSGELSDQEKETINQYIPIEKVAELYRPTISDPIKNMFSEEAFKQDKLNLIKLYVKLALKFPGETFMAFVGNTYGYYYPEDITFSIATGTYTTPLENEKFMDIHLAPIVKIPLLDHMIDAMYDKEIPIVSLFANIGFVFWIVLSLLMYGIYKKNYQLILLYIPIAALYLTCIASPVSGELRYIYSMFTCLPLLLGFSIQKENIIQK